MKAAQEFMPPATIDVVIHHSPCNDGHAAAAVLYHEVSDNLVFVGMHPKDELLTPDVIELITGRNVVMLDIAFSAQAIEEAAKLASAILILDHHVTNKSTLENLSLPNVHTVFVMGEAGVHLTWKYVHEDYHKKPIPRSLHYIGLKDVWKHEDNQDALYFTTAFERPDKLEDWFLILGDVCTVQTIEKGRVIYEYQQSVLKTMMEKVEFIAWRDYRVAIVNVPYPWISDLGAMMCADDPENTIAVLWNKPVHGPFSVSLRSHNQLGPNIEPIAVEFKGGGHAHAAAFRTETPPYEMFTVIEQHTEK